ncbi:hypothetical protein GQ53DRAFT_740611 [Thozetella sp. PMI_491]|nr:hypothetical protein GQ53DRAFT_740611 [Thozetella sp. PMI_491]
MPRKNVQVWSDASRAQLMAWLDFCLEKNIDFHGTVVNHLKTKTGRKFTPTQIRNKLRHEWDRAGRETPRDDLYREGSLSLVHLEEHARKAIDEVLCGLRKSMTQDSLRGGCSTRSRTQSLASSTRSNITHAGSPSEDELLSAATYPALGVIQKSSAESVPDDRQSTEHSLAGKNIKNETEYTWSHDDIPTATSTSRKRVTRRGRRLDLLELESQLAERDLRLQGAEATVARQRNLILSLSNQLSIMEERYKTFESLSRSAKSHQDQSAMLTDLLGQNASLRRQLADNASYKEYVQSIDEGRFGMRSSEIRHGFSLLERHVADGCSSLNLQQSLPNLDLCRAGQRCALNEWANRVAGLDYDQLCSHVLDGENPEFELFRSFVAAGLCSLVFESAFPDLVAAESPLLHWYRRVILAKDGPRTLQRIDLRSNQSLIETECFMSKLIEDESRELSCRLIASLSSFLISGQDAGSSDLSCQQELSNQISSSLNPLSPDAALHETFACALNLKARLVLCRKRFQLVFFQPGTPFDTTTMYKNSAALGEDVRRIRHKPPLFNSKVNTSNNEHHSVRLCIFPALYECPLPEISDEYPIGGEVESCVVECQEFVSGGDLEGYVLVAKAVVLL